MSSSISTTSDTASVSPKPKRKSESSSYSEESDSESSTSTSLCDDENIGYSAASSLEASPLKKRITPEVIEVPDEKNIKKIDETINTTDCKSELAIVENLEIIENILAKNIELLESNRTDGIDDTHTSSLDVIKEEENTIDNKMDVENENPSNADVRIVLEDLLENTMSLSEKRDEQGSPNDFSDQRTLTLNHSISSISNFLSSPDDQKSLSLNITSTSQLSPIPDISKYISMSSISPLRTPSSVVDYSEYVVNIPIQNSTSAELNPPPTNDNTEYQVSDEGVTNEFFERINSAERPNKLELQEYILRRENTSFTLESEKSDNTSRLENYSLTNVSPLSYAIELPIKASLQVDSPLLPPCTDISIITAEKSPLIHENSVEKTDEDMYPSKDDDLSNFESTNRDNSSEELDLYLSNRNRYMKEKSFSMDETATEAYEIDEFTRRSNSEGIVSVDNRSNDRIMKIIEENSMILGRIVRKSSAVDSVDLKAEGFDIINNSILEQPELEKCTEDQDQSKAIESVYESITSLKPNLESFLLLDKSPIVVDESSHAGTDSDNIIADKLTVTKDDSFQSKSIYDVDEVVKELSTVTEVAAEIDNIISDNHFRGIMKSVEMYSFIPLVQQPTPITGILEVEIQKIETSRVSPMRETEEETTVAVEDKSQVHKSLEAVSDEVLKKESSIVEPLPKPVHLKETEKNPFSPLEEKVLNKDNSSPTGKSQEEKWTFPEPLKQKYFIEKNPFSPLDIKVSATIEKADKVEQKTDDEDEDEELDTVPNYLMDSDRKFKSDDDINKPDSKIGKKLDVDEKFIPELSFGRAKSLEKIYSPHSDSGTEDFDFEIDIPEEGKLGEEESLVYSKIVDEINLLKSPEKSPPTSKSAVDLAKEAKPILSPIVLPENNQPFDDLDLSKFSPALELKRINFDMESPQDKCKLEVKNSPTLSRIKSNPEFSKQKDFNFKKSSDLVLLQNDILTTNISDTISSIENTIKSIDSLCPSEAELKSARINKTLDNLEKSLEKFSESNKFWESEKERQKEKEKEKEKKKSIKPIRKLNMNPPPIVVLGDVVIDSNDDFNCSRNSRDIKRDYSPRRRRRDEDIEEYESRYRRDSRSPSNSVTIKFDELPQNFQTIDRIIDDGLNDARDEIFSKRLDREIDKLSHSFDPNKCSRSDEYSLTLSIAAPRNLSASPRGPSKSPNMNKVFPEKLEIRHTTVTSTFYDRFMSYKKEQNSKFDKSPSSPIITKSYLDSLKPTSNYRITKSAENSPSRSKFLTSSYHSSSTSSATSPSSTMDSISRSKYNPKSYDDHTTYIKSCDNIPMMQHVISINRSSELSSKGSSPTGLSQYHHSSHSPFSYSPLPLKTKPPSDFGIKLGLYKNPTENSSKS